LRVKLLDHGYLDYVDHWGSDERVIEAARMSTGKGFLGWGSQERPGDEKLLRYLWTHRHTTPFETPGLTVEVGCPMVVVWQWVRHRTLTFNVLSGRYAEMPREDYLPSVERLMADGGGNRQAGRAEGAPPLTADHARQFRDALRRQHEDQQALYENALKNGVPKELARLALTFARYTRLRVTGNLLNWLRFLTLRAAPEAQHEIRVYADAVGELVAGLFPRTWALFVGGSLRPGA
jgi:thymidylate synthase (FAD)